jgi:hypothetical protein
MLHIIFAVAAEESLAGVPYFGPSGWLVMEGIRAFQIQFFVTCNEKKHRQ